MPNLINVTSVYRKKVLFLSTLPPPYHGASMSSKMCLDILESNNSYEVKNIKLNYSLHMSEAEKFSFKKLFGVTQVIKQIITLTKRFNPDIIYFAPAVTGPALLRDFLFLKIIKLFNKARLIIHLRGQFKVEDWSHFIKNKMIRSLLKCDKIIILGTELIKNLNNIIPKERICILPNAIENTLKEPQFLSIIKQRDQSESLSLLFLSNMYEAKGWFKVLEACKLLKDANVNYICHFVGDWPSTYENRKFNIYVKENQLDNFITYHGMLIDHQKNSVLAYSDILIFPTEYDACPRVIIEAMEFGLPVISNREGTIPSLIKHGETGFILEKNVAVEVFEYVLKLQDKNFRVKMGMRSRERFLENFTLDKYRTKFTDLIS